MTVPVLKVEIAFGDDPLDTTPTWVDVTAYVLNRGVRTRRGRNDPWSPFQPGRAWLTLSNRTRLFDPTYAAGTYYGMLRPRTQINITATYSAVSYPVFRGWIAAWPQIGEAAGMDAVVELECFDALDWASSARLSDDLVDGTIGVASATPPVLWLRQADSRWIDTVGGSYAPTVSAGTFTASASLQPGLKSTGVTFPGGCWLTTANDWTTRESSAGDWSIGFWVATTSTSTFNVCSSLSTTIARTSSFSLQVRSTGAVRWSGANTLSDASSTLLSAVTVNDGYPHWVVFTCESSVLSVYVDGAKDAGAAQTNGINSHYRAAVGRLCGDGRTRSNPGYPVTDPSTTFIGTLQDFAIWESALAAADIATAYAQSVGTLAESTADRLDRVLDSAGWPASWRDIATDTRGTVGQLLYNGQQALTAMREIEVSEQGRLFAARDGDITLLGRYHHQEVTRGSTVQATFSDDGADFGYQSWQYLESDTDVRNDVTVTMPTAQSRSTDSASITAYGRQSETVNTILSTVTQVRDMALGLVTRWAAASGRVAPFDVSIDPAQNWATLLGLELGDRIKVEATPMGVGSQFTDELLVDSTEWTITYSAWRLRLGGAPVPLQTFILGTSALGGPDPLGF